MVPARHVERQRARNDALERRAAGGLPGGRVLRETPRPREDRPHFRPSLERRHERLQPRRVVMIAQVDRALRDDDVGRAVGHLLRERFDERGEMQRARVRREPVVGCHDDVGLAETALCAQRVLDPPDTRVHQGQRLACQGGADPVGVCRAVRIVEPHERHVGGELVDAELQVGVDGALVPRVVRRRCRRRGPERGEDARAQFRRQSVVVVDNCAVAGRVVEQQRGARRARADAKQLFPRSAQDFTERRCGQELPLGARDRLEVGALARVEGAQRVG